MRDANRVHGALHDLEKLGDMGTDPCHLLMLSDRSLYVLHNLVAEEVTYSARYATEFADGLYNPVDVDDPLWQVYTDTVDRFQLEAMTMTCDIEAGLVAIADAIAGLQCGGAGTPTQVPAGDCFATIPNEEWQEAAPLSPGSEFGGDPPPEGFATWGEYELYKCQAANYVWQVLRNAFTATMGLAGLQLTSAIIVPVMAGFAGMLPAVFTPPGAALFIVGILTVAGLSIFALAECYQMVQYLDTNRDDIVCALYTSGTSVEAVSVIAGLIEDAIQFIVWPPALSPISEALNSGLGLAFSQLANNSVVEPLFKLVAGVSFPDVDCDPCGPPGGACEGFWTFDSDIAHAENYSGVTLAHSSSEGHLQNGSVKATNSVGVFVQGWTKFGCPSGITLSATTDIRVWWKRVGVADGAFFLRVFATDLSYQDTAIWTAQGVWQEAEGVFNTLYGKTLEGVYMVCTNGAAGAQEICYYDELKVQA